MNTLKKTSRMRLNIGLQLDFKNLTTNHFIISEDVFEGNISSDNMDVHMSTR